MTPLELEALCLATSEQGLDTVTLTLPVGFRRPPGFPRGALLSVNAAGEKNFAFDPWRLLVWLAPATFIAHRLTGIARTTS